MSEASDAWFLRARGRVLGPFTRAQLESMRDRGQLSQFHEVSRDRRAWISAAQVPEFFAGAAGGAAIGIGAEMSEPVYTVVEQAGTGSANTPLESGPGWFYARGNGHNGPIQLADLQRMVDAGDIGPSTLVWRNGLPNWLPAHQVSELRFPVSAPVPAGPPAGSMPQQFQFAPHPAPRTSGLAIASLVLGLLWLCGLGSLLATIFGAVAINQISRSNGTLDGKGMAIAGLILGIIGLSSYVLLLSLGYLQALLHSW
jgi:hypothetical protein